MDHGNFTELAEKYSQYRPGYSPFVLDIFHKLGTELSPSPRCADVGAGTGIWTRQLAAAGIQVTAVEPNDAMRSEGEKLNGNLSVSWQKGAAEDTGLDGAAYHMVSMASAFHWADFDTAVQEFSRILQPRGVFMALWNTRKWESNPLLVRIENQLHDLVPEMKRVSSGRSEFCNNLTESLKARPEFDDVVYLEGCHVELQSVERYIGLWESVNDVRVQAGPERFASFLDIIRKETESVDVIEAEYLTRAWIARRKS
ncbi:class I SAM-dependent methyltransferase [Oleidesulfovibrio sp.]|uniref:class I SAM-dependent methyltransferase n=1 Tax=Oleidesulfovibrio sp. TaxID=2909707 RepID=UPI003A870FD1